MTTTDRIEKKILLRAPRSRVWRAITNAREFATWFQAKLEGDFVAGKRMKGRITTPGYEHVVLDLTVERMEAERLFSFRWHPSAIDPGVDYSGEPTTLVEFRFEEVPEGTMLTVVESGFDQIPLARRAEAFGNNSRGWAFQIENIERYVGQTG